jgi:hypothetical protein
MKYTSQPIVVVDSCNTSVIRLMVVNVYEIPILITDPRSLKIDDHQLAGNARAGELRRGLTGENMTGWRCTPLLRQDMRLACPIPRLSLHAQGTARRGHSGSRAKHLCA